MKRDMDLIRKILLAIEESPTGYAPSPLVIPPYSEQEIGFNALLAIEHGLVTGEDVTGLGGTPEGIPFRLTAAGFDFLDAARDDTRWNTAKATVAEKAGSVSLGVLTEILKRLTAGQLGI